MLTMQLKDAGRDHSGNMSNDPNAEVRGVDSVTGSMFASCTSDGRVSLWDLRMQRALNTLYLEDELHDIK